MKISVCISVYIALILVVLAIVSAIAGITTKQYELYTSISLICSYAGLLIGLVGWFFLLILWYQEDKKLELEEEHVTDTAETVEYDSCKLTF